MKKLLLAFLLALVSSTSALQADEVRYITSTQAKVMASPEFNGKVLGALERGFEVQVISESGSWLQVFWQTDHEIKGWLPRMVTSPAPPKERVSVLGMDHESSLRDVRRRTSTITTAAAARGLSSRHRQQENEIHPSDFEAVELMESILIDPEALSQFAEPLSGAIQ